MGIYTINNLIFHILEGDKDIVICTLFYQVTLTSILTKKIEVQIFNFKKQKKKKIAKEEFQRIFVVLK